MWILYLATVTFLLKVTGCAALGNLIPPLKEIRSIKASRKLVELPRFLVPEVTSSEGGLEQVDVQDCGQLNITLFMDRIEGQPLHHLCGLTNLGSITIDHVLRLSSMCRLFARALLNK